MNIIYFRLYGLNGAVIDALEYFLYLKSIKNNIKLIFIISNDTILTLNDIQNLINSRYNINFNYIDDIIFEKSNNCVLKYSGNSMMILDWGTFERVQIIPTLWKNVIIWFDYKYGIYDKYEKLDRFDNVKIFKEMHYNYGIDYNFKMAFSLFK